MMKIKILQPQGHESIYIFTCPKCGREYNSLYGRHMRCVSCMNMLPNPEFLMHSSYSRIAFHEGKI